LENKGQLKVGMKLFSLKEMFSEDISKIENKVFRISSNKMSSKIENINEQEDSCDTTY